MRKLFRIFNKSIAFVLALVMTVSLLSSYTVHTFAEDDVNDVTIESTVETSEPEASTSPAASETPAPEANESPEASETPVPEASASPEASETPAPEASASPEASETPVPEASASPEASETPAPEASASPEVSETPAPEASASPEASETPVPEASASPEVSETPAPEASASPEVSETPAPEASASPEASETPVPEASASPEASETPVPEASIVADEANEVNGPQVGDIIWIKSGSLVLKDYTNVESGTYTLRGNYEVKVKNIILGVDGTPAWYEFEFTSLGVGEVILAVGGYKYVKVQNTSVEEPTEPGETPEEIEQGDSKAILSRLDELAEEIRQVSSYEECVDFYEQMMEIYGKAFDNDVLLIETDDLAEIDQQFDELEEYLLKEFGYMHYNAPNAMAAFAVMMTEVDTDTGRTSGGEVKLDKTVIETPDGQGDFLLELSAYATGADREVSVPTDIVLVIDQSASMYTPVGMKASLDHKTLYNNDSNNTSVEQYELSDIKEMFQNEDKDEAGLNYKDKFSQLGYLIAQSRSTSQFYCADANGDAYYDSTHVHNENCSMLETYDIYVVQYVENDQDGKPWYFYRVPNTNSPSTDADSWQGDGSEAALTKYELIKYTDDELGGNHFYFYKSQYGALYDAMTSYVDSVIEDNVGHRLAIVGFASDDTDDYKHHSDGSRLYNSGTYKVYDKDDTTTITSDDYKNALIDVNANETSIWNSVNAVTTDFYGTCHYTGFKMAYEILKATEAEGREQIVILFTDGTPSCDACTKDVHDTVEKAAEIKDLGAEIYTICTSMVQDADFMKYASSDYPDAVDKTNSNSSAPIPTLKYAKQVTNSSDMNNAFRSIEVSSTTVKLDEEAVLKDGLTKYFVLPEKLTKELGSVANQAEAESLVKSYIKVYTANYIGKTDADGKLLWDEAKIFSNANIKFIADETGVYRTIQVTNFDYSENYISNVPRGDGENYYGCKLIVTIPIEPNPDFLGGDGVITNTADSGIYESDQSTEAEEKFPIPDVDVKVSTIIPKFTSKNIYLSQWASLPEVLNLGQFTQNGKDWVIDMINNAYVDIEYTITGEDGVTLKYTIPAGAGLIYYGWEIPEGSTTHPLLKEDTEYTVTCTVTSKNDATNKSYADSTETILVYKPEITFNDSSIELGDTANYANNGGNVVWKHGTTQADEKSMGNPPELEYTFDPVAGEFTEDTSVKVTVTAKNNGYNVPLNQDITEYVTFYRKACDFDGCNHTSDSQVDSKDVSRVNFVVHPTNLKIQISKKGIEAIDENQSTIFRITGENGFILDVVIVGNDSVTIEGLPVGEYTVTELTDWSWRYETENKSQIASASKSNDGIAAVEFENKRTEDKWLSGDCWCENWWKTEENVESNTKSNVILTNSSINNN